MYIIESVNSFGHVMRQTIRRPVNNLPILRAYGSASSRFHRNVRLMDFDGHTIDLDRAA